jgi:peroxiredoxin
MRSLVLSLSLLAGALFAAATFVPSAIAASTKAAPAFTLRDVNGQPHTLAQYKGKVVLVNFWATWCQPCMVEMPHLQKMHTELGPQGLVVLGISADSARDVGKVKPVVVTKGVTYPVLLDPQTTVVSLFNPAKTMPFNVVVDRAGNIAATHSGYNPGDEVTLRKEIEALLAQSAP